MAHTHCRECNREFKTRDKVLEVQSENGLFYYCHNGEEYPKITLTAENMFTLRRRVSTWKYVPDGHFHYRCKRCDDIIDLDTERFAIIPLPDNEEDEKDEFNEFYGHRICMNCCSQLKPRVEEVKFFKLSAERINAKLAAEKRRKLQEENKEKQEANKKRRELKKLIAAQMRVGENLRYRSVQTELTKKEKLERATRRR